MTVRSILIGLVFGALIAAFGYYNDFYLELNKLVGNHFPVMVFGGIVLLLLLVNPVLARIRTGLAFRRDELAVILVCLLTACSIPSSGLMRGYMPMLVKPIQMEKTSPGWREQQVIHYVPSQLLPDYGMSITPPKAPKDFTTPEARARVAEELADALVGSASRNVLSEKVIVELRRNLGELLGLGGPAYEEHFSQAPLLDIEEGLSQEQASQRREALREKLRDLLPSITPDQRDALLTTPNRAAARKMLQRYLAGKAVRELAAGKTPAQLAEELQTRLAAQSAAPTETTDDAQPADGDKNVAAQAFALVTKAYRERKEEVRYEVIDGFVKGQIGQTEDPGFFRILANTPSIVPWNRWAAPLRTWTPLIAVCFVGVIGLSLVIHRQWSTHERLRYPIANVASVMIEADPENPTPPIYKNRLFWLGFGIVLAIHLVNGLMAVRGESLFMPLNFNLRNIIYHEYPKMWSVPHGFGTFDWKIYFMVIGISYFLASDVGFTLGISKYLWMAMMLPMIVKGVDIAGGNEVTGGPIRWLTFGSFLGIAVMILYTGRNYFARSVLAALVPFRRQDVESSSIWGMRIFLVCGVGMVLILHFMMGLDVLLSLLLVILLFVMYVVMSRIVAETGLFFIKAGWLPIAVFVGLFGTEGLSPKDYIIIGLVSMVMVMDPRETLMPFLVNGLKICELNNVKRGRAGGVAMVVLLLALGVGTVAVLGTHYQLGESADDFGAKSMPKNLYNGLADHVRTLKDTQRLQAVKGMGSLDHLTSISRGVEPRFVWSCLIGLGVVVAFSFLRLRYTWWPIHPVLFLVWQSWSMEMFAFSFLLGWLIKTIVTRVGGIRSYRAGQPLMVGLIGGELVAGVIFIGVGLSNHIMEGNLNPYQILPG
jgi:hypothetical protein